MADLYATLGVPKTATADEIRKAYRKLAKQYHPDLNPGNAEAERRFKEISAANTILGDPEKRKAYDAGEIDDTGAERPERRFYREYAEAGPGFRYEQRSGASGGSFEDLGGIFSDLFGARGAAGRGTGQPFRMRGGDLHYRLPVDFLEAANGAKKRVDMPDGKSLDITIPAGVEEGQTLRLKGQGSPGLNGGAAGDALIEIEIGPHPIFKREGTAVRSELQITLKEALLGGTVQVLTVTGPVELKVPKGSNTGRVLRLRGKGIPARGTAKRGDHLVTLRVMLPDKPDAELERFIGDWESAHPYNPRRTEGART